jgi:tetratricopeptide (TPR) repeat protein
MRIPRPYALALFATLAAALATACAPEADPPEPTSTVPAADAEREIVAGEEVDLVTAEGRERGGLAVFIETADGTRDLALWRGPARLLDAYVEEYDAPGYVFSEGAIPPRVVLPAPGVRVVPVGAAAGPIEATSLLGRPLERPVLAGETLDRYTANLEAAYADLDADSASADAWIWVGRRLAYLGRYNEAIDVFTDGLTRFPRDVRFLRHRGHRFITLRMLGDAENDLAQAWGGVQLAGTKDEVEPDGLPNALGIPVSTLHSNIRYHLGLARYLMGDFEGAERMWALDVEAAVNPDMVVASSYWLWLSRMRLGRTEDAAAVLEPISAEMEIIENTAYHRLLLLFRGELTEADLLGAEGDALQNTTIAYGVGAWHLVNGRTGRAEEIFREIVEGDGSWAAFGYIAAEAELAR